MHKDLKVKLGSRFTRSKVGSRLQTLVDSADNKLSDTKPDGLAGIVVGPIGEKHYISFQEKPSRGLPQQAKNQLS